MTLVFTDRVGGTAGTPLASLSLNALVPASQSALLSGTLPTTSGSLTLSFPALVVVLVPNSTTAPQVYPQNAQTYTITGGSGTYSFIDLVPATSGAGTYSQHLGTPASPPAATAGAIRLGYALNTSGTLTFTQLASQNGLEPSGIDAADETPSNDTLTGTSTLANTFHRIFYQLGQLSTAGSIAQTGVTVDMTEAVTADVLAGGSTLKNNLDRIRNVEATLTGQSTFAGAVANSKPAILSDGTNAGTLVTINQLTANGAVTLNSGLNVATGTTTLQALATNGIATFGADAKVSARLRLSNTGGVVTWSPFGGVSTLSSSLLPQCGTVYATVTVSAGSYGTGLTVGSISLSPALSGSNFVAVVGGTQGSPFTPYCTGVGGSGFTVGVSCPSSLAAGTYAIGFSYFLVATG